jgi:glycosyltransferase involved in cell wall biosynthesis
MPKPCRLLVQYVPQAFGCKGMNVPFCWWLSRRPEPVWIVFHEVAFPISGDQPLTHNILGMVTRLMVTLVARRAERIFVTIPSWQALLPTSPSVRRRVTWLAVPSNIPTAVSQHALSEVRRLLAPAGEVVVGHFGTYGPAVSGLLRDTLIPVLRKDPRRRALLVGRNSERFAVTLRQADQALHGQIEATGSLEPDKVAVHLAACDCLMQPFIDGVSSRRTSLMAGLALGLPIVTNAGRLTDPVWKNCKAVVLAPSPSADELRDAIESALAQPKRLSGLRRLAADFYQRNFAVSRAIQTLRTGTAQERFAS